ncbi:MAG: methionine--tRNA ligase [bacterium]|nr:methionine--tRNA ligase [bacterium]
MKHIYVGVAWPYVNDVFHLGNVAGAYLPPDIFARFHRLKGNRVLMVSGSDFHGTPITLRAEKEGKDPEAVASSFHELDKQYLKRFFIEYDLYTSTHTPNHRKVVQEMFLKLLGNGFITILKTEQLYSEHSKKFLQDRYIEGECPHCHAKDARGDQCESCGRQLDPLELINPVSKVDKSALVKKETENYFLDLGKLQGPVKKWLVSRKNLRQWVQREALGWVKEGLKPRAITRDMDYGVPLPIAKIPAKLRIHNIQHKVFYVWFEAVIGYLSAAIEYSKKKGDLRYWKSFFYDKKAETFYFVGQDNLVFHTINWPAQLIAYDTNINLPTNVFVNKFLLLEGKKMSKSRNWFIETPYLLENYSVDALRFYLALNNPEQKALNFTWQDFVETNNNILVATIGNFIHRVLTLSVKNFGASFSLSDVSQPVKARIKKAFSTTSLHMERGEFRLATSEVVSLASFGNRYVDKHQLWHLVKNDKKKAKKAAIDCLAIIQALSVLLHPFTPQASDTLRSVLGSPKTKTKKGKDQWNYESLSSRVRLAKNITPLFSKIDESVIAKEKAKLSLR